MYHLRGARFIPLVLSLMICGEFRLPAAVFTVVNTNNSGSGSFRQALLDANALAGTDTIQFQIAGTPPFTISPTTTLPAISDPVVIDATTQPGFINQPVVELYGALAGSGVPGLLILSGNSTVRGLAVDKFSADGIRMEGAGTNLIQGNFIGVGLSGNSDLGNGESGVMIFKSRDNIIGGSTLAARNIISGTNSIGISIVDSYPTATPLAVGNQVLGNFIGTDVTGTIDRGNVQDGILLFEAPQNTIGGFTAASRNLVSGNGQSGIYFSGLGASGNLVVGNFIGTDLPGTHSISNSVGGITINGGSSNQIGSVSSDGGNLISGNVTYGVAITGLGARANIIQGNLIGTDFSGTAKVPNTFSGVGIYIGCSNNVVGGLQPGARNIISGNKESGIFITNSTGNLLQGNYIGTTVSGTQALGNSANGINLTSVSNNTIGGTNAGQRNVISGNGQNGIFISGLTASNNFVEGNFIGTDVTGASAIGNQLAGIAITNSSFNLVGGSSPGFGNVISGNGNSGIYIQGAASQQNHIEGNFIGTDLSGNFGIPNRGLPSSAAIHLYNAPSNTIGGTVPGAGNLISANGYVAISLGLAGCNGNIVQGNAIGTKIDRISPLGNTLHGIEIHDTSSNNIVGGTIAGAGNVIAYAQSAQYTGVRVRDGCSRNSIRGNSIFGNGALGIHLGTAAGITFNDVGDGDSGANDLQNFPVITSAVGLYLTTVSGTLNSIANKTYALDFYASPTNDPTGYGEGQTWIGAANVTTAGTGNATFSVTFTNVVPPDRFITATATDPNGNTSEFSQTNAVVNAAFLDSDFDGMPDEFEIAAGLNPNNFADAALDSDGDGISNLNEYLAATNPNDANSGLRLLPLVKSGSGALLRFQTVSQKSYGIEFSTNLSAWNFLPNATNIVGDKTLIQFNDSAANSSAPKRFYRVHVLP